MTESLPITILEGPDGAGKTTLASAAFGRAVLANHGPYGGVRDLLDVYLWSMVVDGDPDRLPGGLILDRSWLSEPIYGHVHRGGADRVGPIWRRMLERVAYSRRAVVVLCLPPVELCLAAFRARRGEEYLDSEEKLRAVHARFRLHFDTSLPYVVYDHQESTVGRLLETIDEIRPPRNEGPGVGHFRRGVRLLVGEMCNPHRPETGFPFVGHALSAVWLTRQLEGIGIPEGVLYFVNALQEDGTPTDPGFIDRLDPSGIVALGSVADRWLHAAGVRSHVRIDHPAYWSRFHAGEPYPLAEALGYATPTITLRTVRP